jgi:hypothetical protein
MTLFAAGQSSAGGFVRAAVRPARSAPAAVVPAAPPGV